MSSFSYEGSTSTTTYECNSASDTSVTTNELLSDTVKDRILSVDPNHGSCLVTNMTQDEGALFTHCVPREGMKMKKQMSNLERHWHVRKGSLNLDSRYNIFLSPELRHFYRTGYNPGCWVLIPESHIIKKYHDSLEFSERWRAKRASFPLIPNSEFLYRLLPISNKMDKFVIPRVDDPRASPSTRQSDHVYPFNTLPLLRSHLHPKFAIWECGRTLHSLYPDITLRLVSEYPSLQSIVHLYAAWRREPVPSPQRRVGRAQHERSDIASVDSAKYTPPRDDHRRSTGSRKRKRCPSTISGQSLREYTRKAGKQQWDDNTLKSWAAECQPLHDHRPWSSPDE